MNAGKYTLVVISCAFQLTCITATWLPFMTKFAHATTKHAEKCGAGTTPTALCELVEKHHVSNDLHVYVDFVLFTIYHAILLFLDFDKYFDEFFKKRHQSRFICIATHCRNVQIARLITNCLCPTGVIQIVDLSALLRYKPRIAFFNTAHCYGFII